MKTASWIERTARIGFASIGTVYIIIGMMTAAAAAGIGGRLTTWNEALTTLNRLPLGRTALVIIAIGLFGYSLWLISSAITDSDGRGRNAKGIALRAAAFCNGVVHTAIGVKVMRFAWTQSRLHGGGDAQAKSWTARVMDKPFGIWVIGIAGLALIGYGVYALYLASRPTLSRKVHLTNVQHRSLIIGICRFGIAARGIIFGVIGGSLIAAFRDRNPAHARAMRGAFEKVLTEPYGHVLLILVSLGLAAYGFYDLVKARYRTIRA